MIAVNNESIKKATYQKWLFLLIILVGCSPLKVKVRVAVMVSYFKSAQKIKALLWHGGLGGMIALRPFLRICSYHLS